MNERLRSLPDGWRWARLGEVCEVVMGQSPPGASYNSDGRGVLLLNGPTEFGAMHPTPVQWTASPTRIARPGDFLFCVRGATTGRMNVADQSYCIGRGLAAIRDKDGQVDMGFLPYLLRRATQDILKETAGSTFPNLPGEKLERFPVALPPFAEQKRIAAVLNERMAAVERARAAAEAQLEAAKAMPAAYIRGSLVGSQIKQISLGEGLVEVCNGVGSSWDRYPVLGATRNGLAPAKEPVGKKPERYKLVNEGTIFYNPMRILLGSIAMLDDGDPAGITSPDYVVFRGVSGVLHPRWFYYWLRSSRGDDFIRTLTRGAVRERLLFRRLARASVTVPPWGAQLEAAELMKQVRPIRRKLEEELDAINKLPAALLRRAFSGAL